MVQTDLTLQLVVVQVVSCNECLSLSLMLQGSRNNTCLWCEQVDELLTGSTERGRGEVRKYEGMLEG